jgi:hypothetical protein
MSVSLFIIVNVICAPTCTSHAPPLLQLCSSQLLSVLLSEGIHEIPLKPVGDFQMITSNPLKSGVIQ